MEKSPRREGWGFVESEAGFRAGVYRYSLRNIVTTHARFSSRMLGFYCASSPNTRLSNPSQYYHSATIECNGAATCMLPPCNVRVQPCGGPKVPAFPAAD